MNALLAGLALGFVSMFLIGGINGAFSAAVPVDFALHDNNLDNAIGAVLSGEEAVQAIIDWVEARRGHPRVEEEDQ